MIYCKYDLTKLTKTQAKFIFDFNMGNIDIKQKRIFEALNKNQGIGLPNPRICE